MPPFGYCSGSASAAIDNHGQSRSFRSVTAPRPAVAAATSLSKAKMTRGRSDHFDSRLDWSRVRVGLSWLRIQIRLRAACSGWPGRTAQRRDHF